MNKYSPYYDADEGRTTMTIDATGSWVHIKEVEKLQEENNEMRELLRAVARACRGLEAPTDAALSVLGNVLVRRDEARAEVERLSKLENSLPASLRDAHAVVEGLRAELRTVAERQREACELYLRHRAEEIIDDGGERELAIALHRAADRVEDTPLVTEGEEKP